jgi:hypothetical protein
MAMVPTAMAYPARSDDNEARRTSAIGRPEVGTPTGSECLSTVRSRASTRRSTRGRRSWGGQSLVKQVIPISTLISDLRDIATAGPHANIPRSPAFSVRFGHT